MAAITHEDLICLSKVDLETKKIDYGNRLLTVDTESILRLEKLGYCDSKGKLTDTGVELSIKVKEKEKILRRGVPLSERKRSDPLKVTYSEGIWLTGEYRQKSYMSDGYFFIYGSPYASMKARKGAGEFRKHIPTMLSQVLSMKNLVELVPMFWQLQTLGGLEIIWLVSKDGEIRVPVQAMYFDFTQKKYPSVTFFGSDVADTPILAKVKNRGVPDDVIGVLMPMVLDAAVKKPIMEREISSGE